MSSKKAKEPSKPYSRTPSRAGSPELPEGDAQAVLQKEALKSLVVQTSIDMIMSKKEPERSEFVRKGVLPQVKADPYKVALINKFFSEDPRDLTRVTTLKKMGYNDKSINQLMVLTGTDRLNFLKEKVLPFVKDPRNAALIAKMFGLPTSATPAPQPSSQANHSDPTASNDSTHSSDNSIAYDTDSTDAPSSRPCAVSI
jgi:hypothetical protein